MGINWNEVMSSGFVKFEDGISVTLVLMNWRQAESTFEGKTKACVAFDIMQEDNAVYDKTTMKRWDCSAAGALEKLKPIIEKADAAGKSSVKVSVIRMGKGTGTQYSIKELAE